MDEVVEMWLLSLGVALVGVLVWHLLDKNPSSPNSDSLRDDKDPSYQFQGLKFGFGPKNEDL